MPRGTGVTAEVLAYLAGLEHGATVTVPQLRSAVPEGNEAALQGAMYRISKSQRWPVEVIAAGHLWRNLGRPEPVAPVADPSAVAFTVVERLGGSLVLSDADGGLWLAKRIGVTG